MKTLCVCVHYYLVEFQNVDLLMMRYLWSWSMHLVSIVMMKMMMMMEMIFVMREMKSRKTEKAIE